MDRDDERSGKLQEIVENLPKAYNQFELCGDQMQLPTKEEDDKHSDKPKKSSSSESLEELEIVENLAESESEDKIVSIN